MEENENSQFYQMSPVAQTKLVEEVGFKGRHG